MAKIRQAIIYLIIADETRDISGAEQLAISFRWVDDSYEVYEDLVGLVEVHATDASTLASVIKDTLVLCQFQIVVVKHMMVQPTWQGV